MTKPRPYLPSRDSEPDEVEWDIYMSMSDAEIEAEGERVNREFQEFHDAMTPLEQYRYWRRYVLTSIMTNRRRLRDPKLNTVEFISNLWRAGIKKSQLSLVKHRHHFKTGVWPGSA